MDLDRLAPIPDAHQGQVGSHLDLPADQIARDRIQGSIDLDVMIAVNLGFGVEGKVIHFGRGGQQQVGFLGREHLGRSKLGGAMDAHPGHLSAPPQGPGLRVRQINEVLAGEERSPCIWHTPFTAGLVTSRQLQLMMKI